MKNIPQKIYLQIGDDLSPAEIEELDFNDLSGVTWCTDKIHDTDIEFTISDVEGKKLKAFVDWWHGLSQEELVWYEGKYVEVFLSL